MNNFLANTKYFLLLILLGILDPDCSIRKSQKD